ncbi:MAG: maleylacetoacetate isomerase [Bdellovibrionales bacterium]
MEKLDFYSYYRSSSAYRVRIALHLKNVPHRYHAVHLLENGGEQNQNSYQTINPMAEVPAIIHNGFTLTQSMAILMYLDDCFPEPRLFSAEPQARAKMVQICETINSGIQPLQNLRVLQELDKRFGVGQTGKDAWLQHWISRGFKGLEKMLQQTAGTYSFAGHLSAVDCFLVPQMFVAKRFNIDMNPYPTLNRINENCLRHEAVQKAHPDCQPDTPRPQ